MTVTQVDGDAGMTVTQDEFRHRADAVRWLPLDAVLIQWGADRDRCNRSRWRTERGSVSITGSKFFNWHRNQGGGGAIDLVMHLSGWDVGDAVAWLEQHLGSRLSSVLSTSPRDSGRSSCVDTKSETYRASGSSGPSSSIATTRSLRLPQPNRGNLGRVRRYLTEKRCLSASIIESLIESGKLYADDRGNGVFLMLAGRPNRPIGAELRGTGDRVWRGMASGSRKDAGFFWIGAPELVKSTSNHATSNHSTSSITIVLCESAIDAISCFQLHASEGTSRCISISTAGVRPDAPWLPVLLSRGYKIYCGFDDDEAGNSSARQMINCHPSVKRLRPPAHDWNDAVKGR